MDLISSIKKGALRFHKFNRISEYIDKKSQVGKYDIVVINPEQIQGIENRVTSFQQTPDHTHYPSEKLVKDNLDTKVNAESGKGLSTNDYTTAEKTKLAGLSAVSGTNDGTNWTGLTINGVTKAIPSGGGGGGVSNHNLTFTALGVQTTSASITFAANQRCYQTLSTAADLALAITASNESDNYLLIQNTGADEIDITISSVNSLSASAIHISKDGISVAAGKYVEIGIYANSTICIITASSTIE